MPPEQPKHPDRRLAGASHEPNGSSPEAEPPATPRVTTRDLAEHSPQELCFHNVTPVTLELLLADALPEISPIITECLFQTILEGRTIPHAVILESYADAIPYSITQEREIRLGDGPAQERAHRIIIERHSEEEPCLFKLSLGKSEPRSVDFTISYSSMYEDEKWESVDAWGSSIGLDPISDLFKKTPPELCEYDDEGDCLSLVSGDISIVTTPAIPNVLPVDEAPEDTIHHDRWVPRAIQVSSPGYGEQAAITSHISPDIAQILVGAGLLKTLDAFGAMDADLQMRLLDRASARISGDFSIEFSRRVNVGHAVSEESSDEMYQENLCEGIDAPSEDGGQDSYEPAEAAEEDSIPFSPDPLENPPVTSSASINFYSEKLGLGRLEYFSSAQAYGMELIHAADLFNFAPPVLGVRFIDEAPSARQLATRWRLFREIGLVGGIVVQRRDMEVNLSLSATTQAGDHVSTNVGSHRVLMTFDPPRNTSASADGTLED